MPNDFQTALNKAHGGERWDICGRSFARLKKFLRSPRLATALINAQVRIRGKARLPLSVRLTGRIRLRGDGDVEFGRA